MINKKLTNVNGAPIDDDNNSLSTGPRDGITALQDAHLIEKLAHFNRERIPERIVHAKGSGAFGFFECTKDMSKYTSASFLNKVGKKTNMFARFSTVGGEKGSADVERDPRGFALKFYTEEGNYDIVGNNTPVFFIRDAIKFPDFIHTQKRNPQTNLHDPDMFWDFLSLTPESMHQVLILFSDRGTPLDFRHMDGFGSNTYMWYNKNKEYVWVKYHFISDQGVKDLSAAEADAIKLKDHDHATRDLFNSIANKKYPSWTVSVQIMTNQQAKEYRYDPFDVTKVWLHKDFPLIKIGKFTLNKNPENFFSDVELATFAPNNFVPGISASPDKLLQGRLFAYQDAHRWRVGSNSNQINVNKPKSTQGKTYQADGAMNNDNVMGPNYFPNSVANSYAPAKMFAAPQLEINGILAKHEKPITDIDFEQPRLLFEKVLDKTQQEHLISNINGHLKNACQSLQYRQTALFYKVHEKLASGIAKNLKLDMTKVIKLSKLSQNELVKATPLKK